MSIKLGFGLKSAIPYYRPSYLCLELLLLLPFSLSFPFFSFFFYFFVFIFLFGFFVRFCLLVVGSISPQSLIFSSLVPPIHVHRSMATSEASGRTARVSHGQDANCSLLMWPGPGDSEQTSILSCGRAAYITGGLASQRACMASMACIVSIPQLQGPPSTQCCCGATVRCAMTEENRVLVSVSACRPFLPSLL